MEQHVVILQHGVVGSTEDLRNVASVLTTYAGSDHLRVILSDVNVGKTSDGVAAGGARLANLIRREVPKRGRLSLVGHSLGGLYLRFALLALEQDGWFADAEVSLVNFVTLATPHLGITETDIGLRMAIRFFAWAVHRTAYDLAFHTDLLQRLVGDDALAPLRRFERRAVYGNLVGDVLVRPCTSLLVMKPPVADDMQPGEPRLLGDSQQYGADIFLFGRTSRHSVVEIFERLKDLPWERYAVHFPEDSTMDKAHVKICNHGTQDTQNHGARVVAHLSETFIL
mmetsp:Transcript_49247/g.137959  ORF Transcript_49247/g.137959 Transcript_49247/m.137959 type:complete len:283 (-) Transcript_49247:62-910(-)